LARPSFFCTGRDGVPAVRVRWVNQINPRAFRGVRRCWGTRVGTWTRWAASLPSQIFTLHPGGTAPSPSRYGASARTFLAYAAAHDDIGALAMTRGRGGPRPSRRSPHVAPGGMAPPPSRYGASARTLLVHAVACDGIGALALTRGRGGPRPSPHRSSRCTGRDGALAVQIRRERPNTPRVCRCVGWYWGIGVDAWTRGAASLPSQVFTLHREGWRPRRPDTARAPEHSSCMPLRVMKSGH
jgi:hypothetical protein